MSRVDVAEGFSRAFHINHKYGNEPYHFHLDHVVRTLRRFGFNNDEAVLSAGWLHDCMEDCGVTKAQLEEVFGPQIAGFVDAVTDGPGETRAERKAATYYKIRAAGPGAIALKLADRIANANNCRYDTSKKGLFEMYHSEHESFKKGLFVGGMLERMWDELDNIFKLYEGLPENRKANGL